MDEVTGEEMLPQAMVETKEMVATNEDTGNNTLTDNCTSESDAYTNLTGPNEIEFNDQHQVKVDNVDQLSSSDQCMESNSGTFENESDTCNTLPQSGNLPMEFEDTVVPELDAPQEVGQEISPVEQPANVPLNADQSVEIQEPADKLGDGADDPQVQNSVGLQKDDQPDIVQQPTEEVKDAQHENSEFQQNDTQFQDAQAQMAKDQQSDQSLRKSTEKIEDTQPEMTECHQDDKSMKILDLAVPNEESPQLENSEGQQNDESVELQKPAVEDAQVDREQGNASRNEQNTEQVCDEQVDEIMEEEQTVEQTEEPILPVPDKSNNVQEVEAVEKQAAVVEQLVENESTSNHGSPISSEVTVRDAQENEKQLEEFGSNKDHLNESRNTDQGTEHSISENEAEHEGISSSKELSITAILETPADKITENEVAKDQGDECQVEESGQDRAKESELNDSAVMDTSEALENTQENQPKENTSSDSKGDENATDIDNCETSNSQTVNLTSDASDGKDTSEADKSEPENKELNESPEIQKTEEVISLDDTSDEKEVLCKSITVDSDCKNEVKPTIESKDIKISEKKNAKSPTGQQKESTKETSKSKIPQKCIVCQKIHVGLCNTPTMSIRPRKYPRITERNRSSEKVFSEKVPKQITKVSASSLPRNNPQVKPQILSGRSITIKDLISEKIVKISKRKKVLMKVDRGGVQISDIDKQNVLQLSKKGRTTKKASLTKRPNIHCKSGCLQSNLTKSIFKSKRLSQKTSGISKSTKLIQTAKNMRSKTALYKQSDIKLRSYEANVPDLRTRQIDKAPNIKSRKIVKSIKPSHSKDNSDVQTQVSKSAEINENVRKSYDSGLYSKAKSHFKDINPSRLKRSSVSLNAADKKVIPKIVETKQILPVSPEYHVTRTVKISKDTEKKLTNSNSPERRKSNNDNVGIKLPFRSIEASCPQVKIELEKVPVPTKKKFLNPKRGTKKSLLLKKEEKRTSKFVNIHEKISLTKTFPTAKKHKVLSKKKSIGEKRLTRSSSAQKNRLSVNKPNKDIGKQILSRYLKVQLNPLSVLIKDSTVKLGSVRQTLIQSKSISVHRRLTRATSQTLDIPLNAESTSNIKHPVKKKLKRLKGRFKQKNVQKMTPSTSGQQNVSSEVKQEPVISTLSSDVKEEPVISAGLESCSSPSRKLKRTKPFPSHRTSTLRTSKPRNSVNKTTDFHNIQKKTLVHTTNIKQEPLETSPCNKRNRRSIYNLHSPDNDPNSVDIKVEDQTSVTSNINSSLLNLYNKRISSPVKHKKQTTKSEFLYDDKKFVPRQLESRKLKKLKRLGIDVESLPENRQNVKSTSRKTMSKRKGKRAREKSCDKSKTSKLEENPRDLYSLSYEEIKAQTGQIQNSKSDLFSHPFFQKVHPQKSVSQTSKHDQLETHSNSMLSKTVAHRTRRSTSISEMSNTSFTVVQKDHSGKIKMTKHKIGSSELKDSLPNEFLPGISNIYDSSPVRNLGQDIISKKSPKGYSDDISPVCKKRKLSGNKGLSPKGKRTKFFPLVNQKVTINCETQTDDVVVMPIKQEVEECVSPEQTWMSALESFSRKTSLQSSQQQQPSLTYDPAATIGTNSQQQLSPGGSDKENTSLSLFTQTPASHLGQDSSFTEPRPVRRSSREKKLSGWFKKILASKTSTAATSSASARGGAQPQNQSMPLISQVVSLAPDQVAPVSGDPKVPVSSAMPNMTANVVAPKTVTKTVKETTTQTKVIVQPPQTKPMKNKSMLCKPLTQTKATSCRPHAQSKEVQTDDDLITKPVLVPVPIPLYIPVPMAMYNIPVPYPVPMPIPIPVPCFIPTTKKSATGIMKQITKIQSSMPADPFEAELLAMAAAVAGDEKDSSSESDDDAEPFENEEPVPGIPTPQVQNTLTPVENAEDMLQMAMRMASTMPTSEHVMDMETSLTPTPINPSNAPMPTYQLESQDITPEHTPRGRGRGKRRGGSSTRNTRSKKMKTEEEQPVAEPIQVVPQAPPPDENMVLKFTYGVNAWKHWVMQKNDQLQKASTRSRGRLKMYKTDILACTPDELNFSLCQFVNEVRKPNGEEYAPDSIYYLCLGIQEYIYENGRVDNIFTDVYYDRFTECLNDVIQRYEVRLNAQGLIVCRIEEEHLWESKQLGAHSPFVLLNTLIYFNARYFMLRTPEEHLRLSFSHIMKHWKKTNMPGTRQPGRSVYLRYYAPVHQAEVSNKRRREDLPVYEQGENVENPLRCPVKLYEFYLSKCPESIKNRNDVFYLMPERSCVPDSPVWYSTGSLPMEIMARMLNRIRVIKEIQEAHLAYQPPLGLV